MSQKNESSKFHILINPSLTFSNSNKAMTNTGYHIQQIATI